MYMIDYNQRIILSYIVSECNDSYKVIEIDDFDDFLKDKNIKKKINIQNTLKRLQDNNFISIKYYDDSKYCVLPTPLGKQIFEEEVFEKTKKRKNKLEYGFLLFLICFFAFLGSFLGTLLIKFI